MSFCETRAQVGFPDYLLVDMGIFNQAARDETDMPRCSLRQAINAATAFMADAWASVTQDRPACTWTKHEPTPIAPRAG